MVCVCLCSDLNATDKVALRAPRRSQKKRGGGFGGAGAVAFCIIIRSALVTVEMVECVRGATVRKISTIFFATSYKFSQI